MNGRKKIAEQIWEVEGPTRVDLASNAACSIGQTKRLTERLPVLHDNLYDSHILREDKNLRVGV